jgi:hypothetical protein
MGVHADFMARFQKLVENHVPDVYTRRILFSQAIIKCADISNPVSSFITRIQYARHLWPHDRVVRMPSASTGLPLLTLNGETSSVSNSI